MRLLFIGDVFGTLGQEALKTYLPQLKQDHKPHLIVVNAENIDRGFGIDPTIYKDLMGMGVAMITMGNHTFRNQKVLDIIEEGNILRPANYDASVPGTGMKTIRFNNETVTIISLMGRIFMGDPLDNPFKVVDHLLEGLTSDHIFIDFHAEATSEKLAFAHYVDGRVTAVVGTHTHVPTADALVLPKGTMYLTDVGMTGPLHGILGAERDPQIHKFLTGLRGPVRELTSGPKQLNAVLIDTALKTIVPIHIREDQPSSGMMRW